MEAAWDWRWRLQTPVYFGTDYAVNAIAVGDINHDGKPDIVVAEDPGD